MNIIIADDHRIFREGLRTMLEKHSDLKVVGETNNGRETVKILESITPDVVIMDINMPDMNGIEATRVIREKFPRIKVLGLSMHSDSRFIVQMLKIGAAGYMLKDSAFDELYHALQVVNSGKVYLSPEIAGIVVEEMTVTPEKKIQNKFNAFSQLTDREREILQMIAEGKSTKEIAANLNISIKTIETHRQKICHKLDIFTTAELTKYAIREGITFI